MGPYEGSPSEQDGTPKTLLIRLELDAPTTATFSDSYSLDGSYLPIHRRKRSKVKALLSNAFFFIGSLIYVWVACWNISRLRNDTSNIPSPGMDSTVDNKFFGGFGDVSLYYVVSVLAPLNYVVDAVLQLADLPIAESGHLQKGFHDKPILEVGVQLTFGAAAVCDLMSSLIYREESPSSSYDFTIAAVHWYLVNGILMLSAKQLSCRSRSTRLSLIGDVLFLIGSVIDVFLSYFFNTRTSEAIWRLVSIGKVVTTLLWLIDSILYILANIYEEEDDDEEEQDDDEVYKEDDYLDEEISLPLVVVSDANIKPIANGL
jgi:hypothetical protein